MENFIFTHVPDKINVARLVEIAGEEYADELDDLLSEAASVAVPKVIYTVAPVLVDGDRVTINGVSVVSELMAKNFAAVGRVFPYVMTCGTELEQWSKTYKDDPLTEYWADEIKKQYLGSVGVAFRKMIRERYGITAHLSSMNPGSLKAWPITGQRELFAILNEAEVKDRIGVTLTESMLMLPSKSGSGIGFESESNYENCSLCPIKDCPNRRAKYVEVEKE